MSEDSTPNFTSESSKTTAGSTAADRAQELSDIKLLLTNIRDSIAELTGDVGRLGDDITDISDAPNVVENISQTCWLEVHHSRWTR